MDFYDQASEKEERDRDLAIRAARAKNQPITFTGRCLCCNAQIEVGRFCDSWCREDFELEQKMKKIAGKK